MGLLDCLVEQFFEFPPFGGCFDAQKSVPLGIRKYSKRNSVESSSVPLRIIYCSQGSYQSDSQMTSVGVIAV